ncbi:MAG: arginase family protein [Pseudomonadota bacterium]
MAGLGAMFGANAVTTFMGLPAGEPGQAGARGAILGVTGVTPYAAVGPYCAQGPSAIRKEAADYAASISHVDFDAETPVFPAEPDVIDCGDLDYHPTDFAVNRERVRNAVDAMLREDTVPILIGGDDSLPIPMLDAYAKTGPITILQIDAHIDWRDSVGGERMGLSSGMRRASEMAHVSDIIQVGARGIGSARAADLADARNWGVQFVTARSVARGGVAPVIDLIPAGARVVIALDADALDPAIVPGVIGRVPGGLSYWDVVDLIEGTASRGTIAGFEIAEFMPARDVHGIGALTCARLIATVIRNLPRPD